jgi:hypothetical protein
MDGQPKQAAFGATEAVQGAYNWVVVSHRDPALVTDLGRGRVLLRCSPVPAQREMKVNLTITAPLRLENMTEATLSLPRFSGSNFAIAGDHKLRLHSPESISMHLGDKQVRQTQSDGNYLLEGSMKDEQLASSNLALRIPRKASVGPVAARDPYSSPARPKYVVETLKQVTATPPKHLVVVIDGSMKMKEHADEIAAALKTIPQTVSTSVIVASDNAQDEPQPVEDMLKTLGESSFSGGRDNLQAVLRAAEDAGSSKDGAVLWIHGPQPSLNQEIYIMEPFASAPSFYELSLDEGWTNTNEFFKNHQEIGPFTAITRADKNIGNDLTHFFAKWNPHTKEFVVDRTITNIKPSCPLVEDAEAREMAVLWANGRCRQLLASGYNNQAAELATKHRLVTRVTAATVLERQSDYSRFGLRDPNSGDDDATRNAQLANAPVLQGAANGTIGPVGSDATVISGVNTAGTVRVNNLANLEAFLNIFANGGELLGIIIGLPNMILGFMCKSMVMPVRLSARARVGMGLAFVTIGLAMPGSINWLVASARDSNLFS